MVAMHPSCCTMLRHAVRSPLYISRRSLQSNLGPRGSRTSVIDRFQGLVFPLAISFGVGMTLFYWQDWIAAYYKSKDNVPTAPSKTFEQKIDEMARKKAGLPDLEPEDKGKEDIVEPVQDKGENSDVQRDPANPEEVLASALNSHVGVLWAWGRDVGASLKKVVKARQEEKDLYAKSPVAIDHDVIFRDVAVSHAKVYAVDVKGNVCRYGGEHITGKSEKKSVLEGRNIRRIVLSNEKIYALSKSGAIWVIKDNEKESVAHTLAPNVSLGWREYFTGISAGKHHVLLSTNKGRCFSTPSSIFGNAFGQLGVQDVMLKTQDGYKPVTIGPDASLSKSPERPTVSMDVRDLWKELEKTANDAAREKLQHYAYAEYLRGGRFLVDRPYKPFLSYQGDADFSAYVYEVPSLKGVEIESVACGTHHSIVLTRDGKVLGWGSNEMGQLGIGKLYMMPAVPVPIQAAVKEAAEPLGIEPKVSSIAAGGDVSFFVLQDASKSHLLASGHGQFGSIGNGKWWNALWPQAVSIPIEGRISDIQTGNGHVFVTVSVDKSFGSVLSWGRNYYGQLGLGKRANIAKPTSLEHENNPFYCKFSHSHAVVSKVKWHGYWVRESMRCGEDVSLAFTEVV